MNTSPGSKVITSSTPGYIKVAGHSSAGDGRGSKDTYAKGKGGVSMDPSRFNPMNTKASTYGLDGV